MPDGVTAEARCAVGQWPTGESLVEQLTAGIEQAAEKEADPEQKRRLLAVARWWGFRVRAQESLQRRQEWQAAGPVGAASELAAHLPEGALATASRNLPYSPAEPPRTRH